MNRVAIVPVTLSDITYIGANLREADRHEVLCQCPAGMSGSDAAAAIFTGLPVGWSWIATLDGNPACAFGFQPFNVCVWTAWAFGTRRMIRAIPAVTAHCIAQEQRLIDLGARRVEVRTMQGHDIAQGWLTRLGCRHIADLPGAGRDNETFELWCWTLAEGRPSSRITYRRGLPYVPA